MTCIPVNPVFNNPPDLLLNIESHCVFKGRDKLLQYYINTKNNLCK